MTAYSINKALRAVYILFKESLNTEGKDFTTGNIRKAVFMLAIPMILEMCMESVFAVVDIFFVGKLGSNATATVGLTESVLAIIYSIAIGLSMAVTAMVARRVGEKNPAAAAEASAQALLICLVISVLISATGIIYAGEILSLVGASQEIIAIGKTYTTIMLASNIVIMLLFLINGIFRGAGDAAIAMKSLWIANCCNIILCPLLIHYYGLTGAAIATTIGRGVGVCYQLYYLGKGKGIIRLHRNHFKPIWDILQAILKMATTGTLQFLIGSASWIFMARLVSDYGSDAIAGYTIAIRLIIFCLMPAWGLSNAAATLVGQNLGANQPERAAMSVWKTAKYNAIFMGTISLVFIIAAPFFVALINDQPAVVETGSRALRIISFGYIFYGVGMVMINAFNGAGDSRTPTIINFFWFWIFQIPLAYFLSKYLAIGTTGVFLAIVITETGISVTSMILFRKGKWKTVKV
ncbi:MAG: MATE family efflux transporter [Sphingobacteriia bacterium]|nr:MAG: MATE family efflux transporter [Sphingobacteriia bacterium]TAG29659.1 MAG: MATE family efflux transporter [Sphingobacteriia bacterium]TAH07593.1 MAG: MATE family efflux transporter [Sphingobacteriia bacterium]